jgi:hypothetical protein
MSEWNTAPREKPLLPGDMVSYGQVIFIYILFWICCIQHTHTQTHANLEYFHRIMQLFLVVHWVLVLFVALLAF